MQKIKVNRNILWAETFVAEFVNLGVKYACISPGSRSTPLTYAIATNQKVKSFAIIDERSSGFFALGLAKSTNCPVVLICTSGTAAAEFYPAIIEAYQSKTPLIICTADRPPEMQNVGANQTINQNNIYKNHICWFADAGLPKATKKRLGDLKKVARRAVIECSIKNIGPVHINFPFKKPFEPKAFTDEITHKELQISSSMSKIVLNNELKENSTVKNTLHNIWKKLIDHPNGVIVVGVDNYSKRFFKACNQLSIITGFPIFGDSASNIRFSDHSKKNILSNYDSYLRSEKFVSNHNPSYIIQFGRNFSSKVLSDFIYGCSCDKLLVNKFGDWNNSLNKSSKVFAYDPERFCTELSSLIKNNDGIKQKTDWLNSFLKIDKIAAQIKHEVIDKSFFPNESRIITELLKAIPDGSNLMISNSLPIRDLDLAASLINKKIAVFHNRGASGIEGIISTALGIAKASKFKTFLLTGDLAFYYDMNSLLTAHRNRIPLTVILINNNGGRIFEALPIAKYKNVFEEYFATPHNLDFSKFINGFGGNYFNVKNWPSFRKIITQTSAANEFSVLEIKTDAKKSLALRKKYFDKVISSYNKKLRD